MTENRFDRAAMTFVLCLGVLLLLLQVASSPTGGGLPAPAVALAIVVGLCATAIATIRSRARGWAKPVVKILGALFVLMAAWLASESPPDFRMASMDVALGVILLAAGFRRPTAAGATSDEAMR